MVGFLQELMFPRWKWPQWPNSSNACHGYRRDWQVVRRAGASICLYWSERSVCGSRQRQFNTCIDVALVSPVKFCTSWWMARWCTAPVQNVVRTNEYASSVLFYAFAIIGSRVSHTTNRSSLLQFSRSAGALITSSVSIWSKFWHHPIMTFLVVRFFSAVCFSLDKVLFQTWRRW